MKNSTKTILGVLLGVFIVLAGIYAFASYQNTAIGGTYIEAPTFMYYECSPASSPVNSPTTNIPASGSGWVSCPSNTDKCDITIQSKEQGFFSGLFTSRRLVYQICDASLNNCQAQVIKDAGFFANKNGIPTLTINNLNSNQRIYMDYQSQSLFVWKGIDGGQYYATYNPFIIWKNSVFGGGRTEYTSVQQGCNFPSSAINNLIDKVTDLSKSLPSQTSASDTKLEPYKTRNYIDTYVPLSTENVNFVTYNGNQGYCLNRQVFAISQVQTNGATYNIVDQNFNKLLANSVTCCPGEKEPNRLCNSNFQWEELSTTQPSGSCSAFKPCAGADYQVSGSKELVRYNCINSQCVPETRNVECTSNLDCAGNSAGGLCDTKLYKCVSVASPVVTPINSISSLWDRILAWFSDLGFFDILKLSVTLFGGIIAGLVISDFSSKLSQTLRRNRNLRIALSWLVGIVVAILLYSFIFSLFFWVLLVGFVIVWIVIKITGVMI